MKPVRVGHDSRAAARGHYAKHLPPPVRALDENLRFDSEGAVTR
jgi:hypothetical protein